ncbi:MAG: hypothetical protein QM831_23650 [Kofleriaceae bacterium]
MRAFALILAACAPSQVHLDADNKAASDRADARTAATGVAFTPAIVSVPAPTTGLAAIGLLEGEAVVATPDGELAFIPQACLEQIHCGQGCARFATYHYANAADGHVVIVRMRPMPYAVATETDASCYAGCGGAPQAGALPTPTVDAARLGTSDLGKIQIVDNHYAVEYVAHRCTNTTKLP